MTKLTKPATVVFILLDLSLKGGGISYQLTLNADACREIHLGRFSIPAGSDVATSMPTNSQCHYEIRSEVGSELYFAAACVSYVHPQSWPLAPEKYAVDLNHPSNARRIDDRVWSSAAPLLRGRTNGPPDDAQGDHVSLPNKQPHEPYKGPPPTKGPLLKRSGPKWSDAGRPAIFTNVSPSIVRAAVSSWEGEDWGPELGGFGKGKTKGHFWVDIYVAATADALVRIRGSFDGPEPEAFMDNDAAAFYSDRYYIMPVGHSSDGNFDLRRLLICDLDAAARDNSANPQRSQP